MAILLTLCGIELVGQDSHDPIGELMKSEGTKKNDDSVGGEKFENVSPSDNSIKAGVVKIDVGFELVQERFHGALHFGKVHRGLQNQDTQGLGVF